MKENDSFKPKIDYDNSLTSLACSIQKYFDIEPKHKTLPYVAELFQQKQPENVILLLCDGLGSRVIDQILDKDSYLIKNKKQEIYSVFPPTTASSLNSIKTGLNPSEHGWTGWNMYIEPIKKIITIYKGWEKGKKEIDKDFEAIKDKYYYNTKTIVEQIKDKGKYLSYETNCYPYNQDKDIDVVFQKILDKLKIKGKKYIFSYYPEPDCLLHRYGIKNEICINEIKKINSKVEEYSKKILEHEKTIMFIVSDHGHLISEAIDMKNKELTQYLEDQRVCIENRSPGFLVKKNKEENFKKAFLKDFGQQFYLLSREEAIKNKLFGEYTDETKHKFFETSFGDFIAIAKDSCTNNLICQQDNIKVSYHGGYSDDEIYIPLIVINN